MAALDGLPAFPPCSRWTVPFIRALLRKMGRRKRPGLDGRYAGELALLPDELLGLLAAVLDAVERA
eukprot:3936599-Lingulodinium_polyedra.AAC.1